MPVLTTHTRLMALFPGLPGWAGTRKLKPIWILLKQETVTGRGMGWAICKSAPCSRQITMPAPHHSVFFTGQMPFLPPNQQRQSTEGTSTEGTVLTNKDKIRWLLHTIYIAKKMLQQSNAHIHNEISSTACLHKQYKELKSFLACLLSNVRCIPRYVQL